MNDVTAFLAARLDEDEREAGEFHREDCESLPSPGYTGPFPCNCGHPARLLREVAAKRAVLAAYEAVLRDCASVGDPARRPRLYGEHDGLRVAVMHLTAVYSDHPDYDPEWAVQP